MSLSRSAPAAALVAALLTALAAALRVRGFSDSLNGDELATYFVTTGHGVGRIVDIVQGDQEVTPPLFLVLAGWTQGLGDQLHSLRWTSELAGIAAVPLTYLLGLRCLDRRAATAGAAVAALSPYLIFYSTEARAYSLAMLLTLSSALVLLRALRGGSKAWWALYAVLVSASMWTHYTTLFVLAGQAAWALAAHRDRWAWILAANAAAAIAWLPWLGSYQADQDSPGASIIGLLQPFGFDALKTDLLHWTISHPATSFSVRTMPGTLALLLLGLGLAAAAGGIAADVLGRRRRRTPPREGLVLVVVLALSTPVIAAAYSAVSVSVFLPRNLISSTPGLVLLLGWLVTRPRTARLWIPATAALLAGFAIGAARMQTTAAQRTDYQGVADLIAARGGPDAVVVDVPGLSPGALSQLDAVTAPGQADPSRPRILRLDRASRADQVRAGRPGGGGQFADLPVPTPQQIARQAVAAARGADIYLVNLGGASVPVLRAFVPDASVVRFLDSLPRGWSVAEQRTFPGFFGTLPVSVYVLRPPGGAGR